MKIIMMFVVASLGACGPDDSESQTVEIPINCRLAGFSVWQQSGSLLHVYSEDFLDEDGQEKSHGSWYVKGNPPVRRWALGIVHLNEIQFDVLMQAEPSPDIERDEIEVVTVSRMQTRKLRRHLSDHQLIEILESKGLVQKFTVDSAACSPE